ncbi:EF-hand domain-containing protein [Pseudomonas sp. IT-P258]|uniref:pesticin C-terminus-like muramidase n=1 Tax=Pseudomonas sp. IT-P258 TaxID=3026447 RepID=UPI0039E00A05
MRDLLIWFFGTESSFGRKAGLNRSAMQIPAAITEAPALPEDSEPAGALQPLKNWCHPFKDSRNPLEQLTHLANANAGYYPLGRGGLWHGGVHFDSGTAGTLKQSSVHCLADGEVVAYRIDTHSPKTTYIANQQASENSFSRNFVLVRHHLQAPRIEGSPNTPPSLTFFSLYMHLQDWAVYRDSTLARPGFWPERPTHRVKQAVNDRLPEQPEQRGLNVSHKWHGQAIDLLPRGAEVTISGTGQFRKLENTLGPAALLNPDGSIRGYIAARVLWEPDRKETRVRSSEPRVNVRADPFIAADNVIFSLPVGAEVTVSGTGEFRKLEHINQYVQFDSLENAIEPEAIDQVVVLDTPVAVGAGDLIGHLGLYHDNGAGQLEEKLHLETFSGDDVELFIEACRDWAKHLPEKDKTWLKLAEGTPVVSPEGNLTAGQLEAARASSPVSAANLLVPKTLLDKLPASHKRQIPATPTRNTCNWYHLEGLLHDANNTPLHGWVREEIGVTQWVSPWAWEGYDFIYEYDVPQEFLASFLRTMKKLSESQLERFGPMADEGDTGPLKKRLYDIIDRNGDGRITAEELRAALRLPAHAQAISQLIVCCDSEWYYKEGKWDRLDELLGHSGSTPNLNWFEEKRRIRQLSWWNEVAKRGGLPGHGEVYHFHPIGLTSLFGIHRRQNDLIVERGQVTFDAEGNDIPNSPYFSRRLHWPGGASGVTLGRGYDMRHRTPQSVASDLIAAGVDTISVEKFSRGAGLSGQAARDFVNLNRDAFGAISQAAQRILFEDVVYPRYEVAAQRQYNSAAASNIPKWESLDKRVRDIAVDLTYQQGSIWSRQMPYISENNRDSLANYIQDTQELTQYESGRNRARYLRARE